jgi:hypothetical protein
LTAWKAIESDHARLPGSVPERTFGQQCTESSRKIPRRGWSRPAHTRLTEQTPPGRREKLDVGTLYMPAGLGARPSLLVFFHGDPWIPEVAAKSNRMAAISVLAGEGSGVYTRLFEDPQRFLRS